MRIMFLLLVLLAPVGAGAGEDACKWIKDRDQRMLCLGRCDRIRDSDTRNLCLGECDRIRDRDARPRCLARKQGGAGVE